MTHLVPISTPTTSMGFAALKQKGKFDPMPWKLSLSADPVLLKRNSLYLIITLMALKQRSWVERSNGTFDAKQVLTTRLPSVRVLSCTLILESSISPLRRDYNPEELSHLFNTGWGTKSLPVRRDRFLVPSSAYSISRFAHHSLMAYSAAISTATGLGTDLQLPLGQIRVKLWNS